MRFRTPLVALTFALLCVVSVPFSAYAASATPRTISISLIRAVRLSDSAITLSYKTDENAVGILRYTTTDGGDVTLTDSAPEVDHLFTIQSLDPKRAYTFILKAEDVRSVVSNTYTVLLSPETIGPVGASEMPGYQVTDAHGTVISRVATASSTPAGTTTIPFWTYLIFIVIVGGAYVGYHTQQARKKVSVPAGL